MAAAVSFSCRTPCPRLSSKAEAWLAHGPSLLYKGTCHFKNNSKIIPQRGLYVRRQAESRMFRGRIPVRATFSNRNSSFGSSSTSSSDTINRFYTCINEKNLKQLREIISEDCYIEDCSFPQPFQGKKEFMQFLEQLTACMGQNVKFTIGPVCEGDELAAGVKWHLEWKKKQIPFTRGCSFFECSKKGERIIIEKAQFVIESPFKPGGFALILLKTVTSLFDDFPKATEWFLRSPHVIVQWALRIYAILVAPFINPLLEGYIKFWNVVARTLLLAFNILRYISKFFFN
ncbi:uncharacterized protein LOC121235670 isoform X1 [Juglans microcarpa x Juglans regia]|uniref:uncharacterized protein LOC121235670 isoform X1 n=1 Tax=Juglans microcarpa x Juglans regia TaxID=2249226 RepID=UPI001B7EE173|nr:uncharacterized protein LOC121235670 isoform X1 [Juglans microcarpa x Juglans regia]